MHFDQFWPFSKPCHFSNIRCFLKPFFAQNNYNVLLESIFAPFLEFYFLNQSAHFPKDRPFILTKFGHFRNLVIFRILGVF